MPQNIDPRNTPNYDPRTGQYHADVGWKRYQDAQDPANRAHPLDALKAIAAELIGRTVPRGGAPMPNAYQAPTSQVGGDIELPNESINQRADALVRPEPSGPVPSSPSMTQPALKGLQMNAPRVMPGAGTPREAVDTLTSGESGMRANDPLELARLRQEQIGREEDKATPNQAVLGLLNRDVAEDPFTGDLEKTRIAGMDKANQAAYMGGFRTPQEEAEAGRQAETYKVDAPVRAQQVAGQYDVEKQRLAGESALGVAREQQGGITSRYGALQDLIQGGGLGNIRSVNPQSGAISMGTENKIATPILDAVTNARRTYEQANNSMNPFKGSQVENAKSALDAAIASALSQHPADATLKQFAQIVANDPQYANMSLPQILQAEGEDQLTPQEMNQLQELLYITRGK